LVVVGVPLAQPVVHLDARNNDQPRQQVLTGHRMEDVLTAVEVRWRPG
jgi:hypothetical protein